MTYELGPALSAAQLQGSEIWYYLRLEFGSGSPHPGSSWFEAIPTGFRLVIDPDRAETLEKEYLALVEAQ